MTASETIPEMVRKAEAEATAVLSPGRPPLTYRSLRQLIEKTTDRLNALGLGRGDRIAIVLPNGPEMATAFLSIASAATAAPLNPAYRREEFDFYLDDLKARALIVADGAGGPAVDSAARRNIPVLELRAGADAPAGEFTLHGEGEGTPGQPGSAEGGDVALVLHTSGTTSRPKIVPLSQRNITASARHIAATLALGPEDRCLNIMPLFHIHGLMAAVMASLEAGGSVYCTPGFNALRFFANLSDAAPTWYTAVPTMHMSILDRASRNAEIITAHPLRFIRSSSSSLPPQVMAALEETFSCPVIESYGMTEAAHQMASNPLPPGVRKPGTVGPAAGPEISIMAEDGKFLDGGATGEVVIRGPNVTSGYESNAKANAEAFADGWFRTGDQGFLDGDGFLTITGRIKEIINRGGEKISPREVDEVLLDHEAIAQAVTFALPHEKLGEEVAAAIVLKAGASLDERAVKEFARTRLADFKVPRKVVFLDEIPKGATGKLQRIGLAEKLGLVE